MYPEIALDSQVGPNIGDPGIDVCCNDEHLISSGQAELSAPGDERPWLEAVGKKHCPQSVGPDILPTAVLCDDCRRCSKSVMCVILPSM